MKQTGCNNFLGCTKTFVDHGKKSIYKYLQCNKMNLQETLCRRHYSPGLWANFKPRFFYRKDAKTLKYMKVIVKKFFVNLCSAGGFVAQNKGPLFVLIHLKKASETLMIFERLSCFTWKV